MEISDFSQASKRLHQELLQLVMNVIIDKTGNYDKDPFTIDMYRLRDNVLYRSSSLVWHLNTLHKHHEAYENQFKKNPSDPNIYHSKSALFFIFDDLIFNLMSLYDYYANLLAYFILGPNKQTIGWNSLAKSAKWGSSLLLTVAL